MGLSPAMVNLSRLLYYPASFYNAVLQPQMQASGLPSSKFKPEQWATDIVEATSNLDMQRLSTLIEQLPTEIEGDQYSFVTGETYKEFIDRMYKETEARLQEQEQAALIADNTARSERAMQDVQTEAQTGFTRAQFRESLTDVFGLTDDMADAVMDITYVS